MGAEEPQNYIAIEGDAHSEQALLNRIVNRIRQSLELTEILSATVAEVRDYLGTDRVKIYQFLPDGHGWVIAEALNADNLPSLKGLHFPADDIPTYARELYLRDRQRTIVNVEGEAIGFSPLINPGEVPDAGPDAEAIDYRPIDPCHLEYMLAMGVKSSVVVPIVLENAETPSPDTPEGDRSGRLWGLLVSHNATSRSVAAAELSFIQSVVDQVSVAISQSVLLERVREQARREADVNRVTALLYTSPMVQLQRALEETVAVYNGSGGRLYLANPDPKQPAIFYNCGEQPAFIPGKTPRPIEEHALWQRYLTAALAKGGEPGKAEPWSVPWMRAMYALDAIPPKSESTLQTWAIADIYQEPLFRSLVPRFQKTEIRGALICPLHYGEDLVGCLTIFRNEVDREIVWAGYHTPDERQLTPRQSFDAWRQLTKGYAQEWSQSEIRLIQSLAERFAVAVTQYQLNQRIQSLNSNLERQVRIRTEELNHSTTIASQQRTLADILAKLQNPLDIRTLFRLATKEVQQLLQVDRVAVYRFDADWGGEFVDEYGTVSSGWAKIMLATRRVWNDSYLQETAGGQYRRREISVVPDIYEAGLTPCHLEILEHYYIRAYLIVPLFIGQDLWGLLGIYQHEKPRQWEDSEVTFVTQLATHLGVALRQGESLEKVRTQADELALVAEQQRTLNAVFSRIRESLDLDTIFKTATFELRQLLNVDRAIVFQFATPGDASNGGKIVAEDIKYGFSSLLNSETDSCCCFAVDNKRLAHGNVYAIDNVSRDNLDGDRRNRLRGFGIEASLAVPLFDGVTLWGLLCLHQCSSPRAWGEKEEELTKQVAIQLGVAIKQAQLLGDAERAREAADAANLAKSRFLATMSHELRTPLNAILGVVQLLDRDNSLTEKHYRKLGTIRKSGEHLLSLINDVLEMSRIESGQSKIVEKRFKLPNLLDNLHGMFEQVADEKSLELKFELAKGIPEYILADEGKLCQVLVNLLGNALKFTDRGSVTLKLSVVRDASAIGLETDLVPLKLFFVVEDTGPGIPPRDLERIFNAFAQSSNAPQASEGTGLGLTICRQFVELMGGEISVESVVGVGSVFRFHIQAKQASVVDSTALLPQRRILGLLPDRPAPRILVVEDKATNRDLLVEFLKSMGFAVREAAHGKEAIERWLDWEPELIWMDMRMPVMDGYAATRQIVHLAEGKPPVIIALTANAFEQDRLAALDCGCADFVCKPYQEREILDAIAKHLNVTYRYEEMPEPNSNEFFVEARPDASAGSAPAEVTEEMPDRALKILVAEDNPSNQLFIAEMLEVLGHNATIVGNGKEVITELEKETYEVLMLDVHMPVMDGLEATRQIRENGDRQRPTIIGITGSSMPAEIEACHEAGMDKILQKPINFNSVDALLKSLAATLGRSPEIPATEPAEPTEFTASELANLDPSNPEQNDAKALVIEINARAKGLAEGTHLESIDLEPIAMKTSHPESTSRDIDLSPAVLDRQYLFDDYQEAFGDLAGPKIVTSIRKFLTVLPESCEAIRAAIAAGDGEELYKRVHFIKSSAGIYGAMDFYRACADLELAAQEESTADYPELWAHLDLENQRLVLSLHQEIERYSSPAERVSSSAGVDAAE